MISVNLFFANDWVNEWERIKIFDGNEFGLPKYNVVYKSDEHYKTLNY